MPSLQTERHWHKYYVHVDVHKVSESCFPSGWWQNSRSFTMLFIFQEMFFTCCFHWYSALCLKSVKFLYATVYVRVFQFALNILTRCQLLLQAYSFRLMSLSQMSYDRIRTKPLSTGTPSLELNWSIKWIKTSSLVVFGVIVVLLHIRLIQYIPLAWTVLWKQWQKNSQQVILKCFHSKFHIMSVMLFKNQHMHTISVTCGILKFKLVQSFRKTICLYGATLQDLTVNLTISNLVVSKSILTESQIIFLWMWQIKHETLCFIRISKYWEES